MYCFGVFFSLPVQADSGRKGIQQRGLAMTVDQTDSINNRRFEAENKSLKGKLNAMFAALIVAVGIIVWLLHSSSGERAAAAKEVELWSRSLDKMTKMLKIAGEAVDLFSEIATQAGPPRIPGTGNICLEEDPDTCYVLAPANDGAYMRMQPLFQAARSSSWAYYGGGCAQDSAILVIKASKLLGKFCYGYWKRRVPPN